jgi:hypothetical protein
MGPLIVSWSNLFNSTNNVLTLSMILLIEERS